MKKLLQVVTLAIIALLSIGVAAAANSVSNSNDVDLEWIKVNGDIYDAGDTLKVDLGEDLEVRLKIQALNDTDDIEVRARLVGYEYSDRETTTDASTVFDLEAGDTEYVNLNLDIPVRADKDTYELRIDVDGRRVNFESASFTVRVAGPRNQILIRDVVYSPGETVVAGRALLTQVRLENIGERDQDDVKVTVRIPTLNLVGSVYLDDIDGEDSLGRGEKATSEEIYLRIPECAAAGYYDVEIEVEFNEYDSIVASDRIAIVESELCGKNSGSNNDNSGSNNNGGSVVELTKITAPTEQEVTIGVGGATFPLVIENTGLVSKSYVVSVTGTESWGRYQVSDMTPVVSAGSSKVVYVHVSANDDALSGKQAFAIEVSTGDAKQSIVTYANLVEGQGSNNQGWSGWMKFLYIVIIILVVILIILGFIAIIAKLSSGDDKEDGKAYY